MPSPRKVAEAINNVMNDVHKKMFESSTETVVCIFSGIKDPANGQYQDFAMRVMHEKCTDEDAMIHVINMVAFMCESKLGFPRGKTVEFIKENMRQVAEKAGVPKEDTDTFLSMF